MMGLVAVRGKIDLFFVYCVLKLIRFGSKKK